MLEKSLHLSHKLAECVHACNDCFNGCLEEMDIHAMKKCIKLDKECATICATTLNLVYAGSHFTKEILHLCEKACLECAAECSKFHHYHCIECAKICKECAEMCRNFL